MDSDQLVIPKWVPDDSSDSCNICDSTFTFFFRRHHCRVCGWLVCNECSPYRMVLPHPFIAIYGEAKQRVCIYCEKAIRISRPSKPLQDAEEQAGVETQLTQDSAPVDTVTGGAPSSALAPALATESGVDNIPSRLEQHGSSSYTDQDDADAQPSSVASVASIASISSVSRLDGPGFDDAITGKFSSLMNDFDRDTKDMQSSPAQNDASHGGDPSTPTRSRTKDAPSSSTTPSSPKTPNLTINVPKQSEISLNALETPSGKRASKRTKNSSLKSTLERPVQGGTPSSESNQLNSHLSAKSRMKSMRKNQLTKLILKGALAAADLEGTIDASRHIEVDEDTKTHQKELYANQKSRAHASNASGSDNGEESAHRPVPVAGKLTIVDLFNALWAKSPAMIIDPRPVEDYQRGHVPFAINVPFTEEDYDPETLQPKVTLAELRQRVISKTDGRAFNMRKSRTIVICGGPTPDLTEAQFLLNQSISVSAIRPGDQPYSPSDSVDSQGSAGQDANDDSDVNHTDDSDSDSDSSDSNSDHHEPIPSSLTSSAIVPPSGTQPAGTLLGDATTPAINEYSLNADTICTVLASMFLREASAAAVDVVPMGVDAFLRRYPFLQCHYYPNDVFTENHFHISRFPSYPSEILDFAIFLGSKEDAKNPLHLQRLGVTHILNAAGEIPNYLEDSADIQLKYLKLPLNDDPNQSIMDKLNRAFGFIDNCLGHRTHPGKVLIHCQLGISRSATLVIAYIMRMYKCTLQRALAMVRSRRQMVLPNPGFLQQLAHYEALLLNIPLEETTLEVCMKELYPDLY